MKTDRQAGGQSAEDHAGRRSAEQLIAMADALDEMRRHTLATPEGRAADQRFHKELLAATANDALQTLASSVGAAVSWTTTFKQRTIGLPRDPLPDHIAVFEAIAAQDAERARAAMVELLGLAFADMGKA